MSKKRKTTRAVSLTLPKRGRPRQARGDGPTPETLRKLQPDLLRRLVLSEVIDVDEAAAGRAILDAWELITGPVDCRRGSGGYSDHDSPHAIRLQAIWRVWAPEVFRRTWVLPSVIVDWIKGEQQRPWDKEAGPNMKAALAWWLKAARQATRDLDRQNNTLTLLRGGTIYQYGPGGTVKAWVP